MNLTRRNFAKLLIITMATGRKAFAGVKNLMFLRPPGALSEDHFLSKCNRCQKCIQVCPTKVIMPASLEFGFIKMNTPVLSFSKSYCNSCLRCTQECPTGALLPVTKDSLDIGCAEIIKADCVAWDFDGCTVCVDKCPLKAIELDENKCPVIITEKCNGCGLCEAVCPSPSLRSHIKNKGIIVKRRHDDMPVRAVNSQADVQP
jgi:ferredoxin-type protein NapG